METYLVEVRWYGDFTEENTSYHALRAADWIDLATQLKSYYRNDMISFTATWTDMDMADLSKEEYERLLHQS